METITLPHCTQFAYCNNFEGPITQLMPAASQVFENPYSAFLRANAEGDKLPFRTRCTQLGAIRVDLKHYMGLCEGLAEGDQDVVLTEYTISAPVICRPKDPQPSMWMYFHTQYQMHPVFLGPQTSMHCLSAEKQSQLNEDVLLRKLGYELLELNQPEATKSLIAMGNDPFRFKELQGRLSYRISLKDDVGLSAEDLEVQRNNKHCWQTLCLMVAASQSQLATHVLEHFCVPGHESSIQHLKQCAEAACQVGTGRDPLEQFPCEECCKALEQIAYTSLSKELDDLRP